MAKKRRKRRPTIDRPSFEFRSLPARQAIVVDIGVDDDGGYRDEPRADMIPRGCVVKPVLRYREGNEAAASAALEKVRARLLETARYVRPAERIVARAQGAEEKGVPSHLPPGTAIKAWLREQSFAESDREAIEKLALEYVGDHEFSPPVVQPFTIDSVSVKNFMPFRGEYTLEVPGGLIGVVGRYEGQEGRSNRAGKSAFLDAILYALYDEARGAKVLDDAVHAGESEMAVRLLLGGTEVQRGYSGGKTRIYIDGNAVKSREAATEVSERIVGMGKADFLRTCYVRQGDLEAILSQTSGRLKEDIFRWRGLDYWLELETLVKADLSVVERGYQDHRYAEAKLSEELEDLSGVTEAKVEKAKARVEEARRHLAKFTSLEAELRAAQAEHDRALRHVQSKKRAKLFASAARKIGKLRAKLDEMQEVQSKIRYELRQLEDQTAEISNFLRKGFDGVCPIDSEQCPRCDEINSRQEVFRKKKKELEEKRKPLVADLRKLSDEIMNVEDDLREAEREKTLGEDARREVDRYDGPSLEEAEKRLEDLERPEGIREAKRSVEAAEREYDDIRAAFRRREMCVEKIAEHRKAAQELAGDLRVLRAVRLMFSSRGIPMAMVQESLRQIERQVNSILEKLGTDHRLRFETGRELKSLAKVCRKCGAPFPDSARVKKCTECGADRPRERSDELRPMITEGSRKQTFDQDSGAGRALIALATRVSIALFLGAKVLFLDEVCGALDSYHLDLMIRLLQELPRMGFRQVFVISHQQEVADSIRQKIVATRIQEENRSELSVEAG